MASQRNEDLKKFNRIGYGILGGILLIILLASTIAITNNDEVEQSMVTESRFLSLDYEVKTVLDMDWEFTFCSLETIEGSGDYADKYYPMVIKWHIYVQDYFDHTPIASQDYREGFDDYLHPTEPIEFKYTFDSSIFEKGIIILKLRVDLEMGNETHSHIMRDRVDFEIAIEGLVTAKEFGLYVGLPLGLILLFVFRNWIQKALNKRLIKPVRFLTVEYHLAIFLFNWFKEKLLLWRAIRQFKRGKIIQKPTFYQLELEANPNWEGYDDFQSLFVHVRRKAEVQKNVKQKRKTKSKN